MPPVLAKSTPIYTRARPQELRLIDIIYNGISYETISSLVWNVVLELYAPKKEMAEYFSSALFSLAKSTLIRAICKNHLLSWSRLSTLLVIKHLPKSVSTDKIHLDQERTCNPQGNLYVIAPIGTK